MPPYLTGEMPGDFGWDPLQMGAQRDIMKLRERELIHGRWAMLAAVGVLVPECTARLGVFGERGQHWWVGAGRQSCCSWRSPPNAHAERSQASPRPPPVVQPRGRYKDFVHRCHTKFTSLKTRTFHKFPRKDGKYENGVNARLLERTHNNNLRFWPFGLAFGKELIIVFSASL